MSRNSQVSGEPRWPESAPHFETLSRRILLDARSQKTPHSPAATMLNSWFALGWTRHEQLHLSSHDPESEVALWCSQIFKRGLDVVTWDGVAIPRRMPQSASATLAPLWTARPPAFATSSALVQRLKEDLLLGQTLCVLDAGFAAHWPEYAALASGSHHVLTYDPKESTKRFETLVQWYAAHRPEYRRLWSIGGGITSDLAGFYCGLLGLEHHATPTTLLSAFDASIGGKTAANFPPWGKNQIGLFHETTAFVMATEHFSTLSAEAIFSALAESIKHIWLAGSKGLEHLDTIEDLCNQVLTHGADPQAQAAANLPRWLWQGDALQNAILFNQNVKSCFVELDPYESGPRMALNFGHTLAHVLEALADEGWLRELPHGLAVAVGMKFMLTSGLMIDPHADRFVRVLDKLLCCTGSMPPFVVTKPDTTRTTQPPGHQTKDMDPKSFWDRFATLAQADKKSASRSTGQSGSEAAVTFVMPPFGYGANLKSTQNHQKPAALLSCNEFLELCRQHKIFVFDP